jgi:hypothetical protein
MIKSIKTAPIKTEEGFYFNERSKKKQMKKPFQCSAKKESTENKSSFKRTN